MRRTDTYFSTMETTDPELQPTINLVRSTLRKINASNRVIGGPQWFLRVRGRLGKDNPSAPLYRTGGPLHRSCAQDINLGHSTRVDLYISQRSQTKHGRGNY